MRALGYENSLAGMDDEDIEEALARMDGGRAEEPTPQGFVRIRPGVDRDFAERMFRRFARPFDPNWKMPDLDGPGYIKKSWPYVMSNTAGYEPGGNEAGAGMRLMKGDVNAGDGNARWDGDRVVKYAGAANGANLASDLGSMPSMVASTQGGGSQNAQKTNDWEVTGSRSDRRNEQRMTNGARAVTGLNVLKESFDLKDYWQEVYDAAYAKYNDHKKASAKAWEAVGWIGLATTGVVLTTPEFPVAAAGASAGINPLKKWVKKQVLENDNPNLPGELSPGATPPGPG